MMNEALALLDEMKRVQVNPDVITYTALIAGFAKAKSWTRERIWSSVAMLLEDMKARNVKLDVAVFASLIRLCSELSELKRTERYFKEMTDQDIQPDFQIYFALIRCCEKVNKSPKKYLQPCICLLRDKMDQDPPVSRKIYTAFFSVCASARDDAFYLIWEALKLFLKQKNFKLYAFQFRAMIQTCLCLEDFDRAYSVLEEMESLSIAPNSLIFIPFFSYLVKKKDSAKTQRTYAKMEQLEIEQTGKLRTLLTELNLI